MLYTTLSRNVETLKNAYTRMKHPPPKRTSFIASGGPSPATGKCIQKVQKHHNSAVRISKSCDKCNLIARLAEGLGVLRFANAVQSSWASRLGDPSRTQAKRYPSTTEKMSHHCLHKTMRVGVRTNGCMGFDCATGRPHGVHTLIRPFVNSIPH